MAAGGGGLAGSASWLRAALARGEVGQPVQAPRGWKRLCLLCNHIGRRNEFEKRAKTERGGAQPTRELATFVVVLVDCYSASW